VIRDRSIPIERTKAVVMTAEEIIDDVKRRGLEAVPTPPLPIPSPAGFEEVRREW
jgi:hypothetical protein